LLTKVFIAGADNNNDIQHATAGAVASKKQHLAALNKLHQAQ